jgi:hypothetical protein
MAKLALVPRAPAIAKWEWIISTPPPPTLMNGAEPRPVLKVVKRETETKDERKANGEAIR